MAAALDRVIHSEPVPSVSICIPAYNQVHFLKKTLASIAAQRFRNFEVVITDDSSNDQVQRLVEEYAGQFTCRYHRNATQLGSPANWNAALNMASGDLVKIMHHDDWFAGPDSLGEMVKPFLADQGLPLVFCSSEVQHIDSGKVSHNYAGKKFLSSLARDPRILFRYNLIGAPSATIFRRTDERFDVKLQYLVDVDFYIRLLQKDGRFHYLSQPHIVNTAEHEGQVTAISKNTRIQVGEHLHLFARLYGDQVPSFDLTWFFVNLFDSYELRSLKEVSDWGYDLPRAKWYFALLVRVSRIKRFIRQNRPQKR